MVVVVVVVVDVGRGSERSKFRAITVANLPRELMHVIRQHPDLN